MYATSLAQKKASLSVWHMSLVTVVAAAVCFNDCWVWQDKKKQSIQPMADALWRGQEKINLNNAG